jgi:hypothetical protein
MKHSPKIAAVFAKLRANRIAQLMTLGTLLLILAACGFIIRSQDRTATYTTTPAKPTVTANRVTDNVAEATHTDSTPQPNSTTTPQETTSKPQVLSAAKTTTPQTSPPFITATIQLQDTTQSSAQTCDFTAIMTASVMYHAGQFPYTNHVVSFTLNLLATDSSASFSQTFSHTFAPGESKQFAFSHSFAKPTSEYTYQVKANGTMAISSGSATLGPVTTLNPSGTCGPRSPGP